MSTPARHRLPRRTPHGVVDRPMLHAAGLSNAAIRHLAANGDLHPLHEDVWAVGRPEVSVEGRWLAAVLACGAGAALSHHSAALLWGVLERGSGLPHVTVPTDDGRPRRPGLVLHRSRTLTAEQVTRRRAVPVTTLPRTLLDLARVAEPGVLEAAVRGAERVHRLDLRALQAGAQRPRCDVGAARLRALLDRYVRVDVSEAELEARFLALCERHRLPRPVLQCRIAGFRADFAWPHARLVVETDGRGTHDTFVAFRRDREKDRALQAAGWVVLRFTWSEVLDEPAKVAGEVRAALRRGEAMASR